MTDLGFVEQVPAGWRYVMEDTMAALRQLPRGDEVLVMFTMWQANAELQIVLDCPDTPTKEAAEAIVDRARIRSRDTCQRCGAPEATIEQTTHGPTRQCQECRTSRSDIPFAQAARTLGTTEDDLIARMAVGEFPGRKGKHGFYMRLAELGMIIQRQAAMRASEREARKTPDDT